MNARMKFALTIAGLGLVIPQAAASGKGLDAKAWSASWQLNSDKSKFSSPRYTPKRDTRTYTATGRRLTMHSDMVDGAGKPMKWSYSASTNGQWYPTHGNPNADHVSLTYVGARELKSETRFKGKSAAHSTLTVSADGKTLTISRSLSTPGGPTDDVMVYDRK